MINDLFEKSKELKGNSKNNKVADILCQYIGNNKNFLRKESKAIVKRS